MKKIIVISLIFISTIGPLKAQIYVPDGIIQGVSGNSNVGIGNANPSYKLDVDNGGYGAKQIRWRAPGGQFGYSYSDAGGIGISNGDPYSELIYLQTVNKSLNFYTNSVQRAVIDASGNVGIGTANPTQKLDVAGNINMAGSAGRRLFMGGVGGSTFGVAYDSNYPNYGIFYTEGEPDYVSISPNGNATAGVVNILGNGNVGIGEANPQSKLTIKDGNQVLSFLTNQKLMGTWPPLYEGTTMTIQSSGYSAGNLAFATGNTENMRIITNGNVGIGTTTPDTKLTVNGNIHAKEVKIDLSIPAPDYVFAKDYKLKSLQEVEDFIKKNNHLPDIPSAAAFEKNGVMLAEMNMGLLKKIEELTLYMIEQKKEIEELKTENNKILKIEQEGESLKSLTEKFNFLEVEISKLKSKNSQVLTKTK
jgi:hypothetical protein